MHETLLFIIGIGRIGPENNLHRKGGRSVNRTALNKQAVVDTVEVNSRPFFGSYHFGTAQNFYRMAAYVLKIVNLPGYRRIIFLSSNRAFVVPKTKKPLDMSLRA